MPPKWCASGSVMVDCHMLPATMVVCSGHLCGRALLACHMTPSARVAFTGCFQPGELVMAGSGVLCRWSCHGVKALLGRPTNM